MAIRGKSLRQELVMAGAPADWLTLCERALKNGGFTKVHVDYAALVIGGQFHKGTVWGEIAVQVEPEQDTHTRLRITASASKDNIWTLFMGDPNERIVDRFIRALPPPLTGTLMTEGSPSITVELARLVELHQNGALSDEEFAAAKRRLLG